VSKIHKINTNFNRFSMTHPCDGLTDGQTDGRTGDSIRAIAYMLSRVKTDKSEICIRIATLTFESQTLKSSQFISVSSRCFSFNLV